MSLHFLHCTHDLAAKLLEMAAPTALQVPPTQNHWVCC